MAKSSNPTVILLTLCSQIIFMYTSASDITLSSPQTIIMAQIGEELHITCLASKCGNKDPDFMWSSLADKTLSGTVKTKEKTSNLTMKIIDETDGTYRCTVSCDNPPVEKRFTISVYSFPGEPILHVSSFAVGQQSSIICTFLNIFPVEQLSAKILLDGELVATNDGLEYHSVGMGNVSLTYDLILTKEMDEKTIECVAGLYFPDLDTESIQKHTTQIITVIYPPAEPDVTVQPSTTVKADPPAEPDVTVQPSASVKAAVPPKNTVITITPSETVKEGEHVHIQCKSEAFPTPTLVLMMETELGIIELKTEQGQYSISHATVDDAGTYKCKSSNVIGQQTAEVTLTVQVPPQNTHISIYPSSVVREGDNIQIKCMSEASPAPQLALKMKVEHDLIDLVSEGGEYNISNVGIRHIGTYICESTNAAGGDSAEATLNVEVAPKNTIVDIIPSPVVKEGDSVQIWCSSEGSPHPTLVLKMRTEDGLVTLELTDGSYNITHVGIENAGMYICESNNVVGEDAGQNTLTVHVPPRNTTVVVTPSQNIKEGDTVTITCETNSIPSPTIILQKVCAENNTVLQSNNGTFTLHNVTRHDTGTYIINITNSAGNETEAFSLFVEERQEQSPRFNPTSIFIFGSVAFVSAGVIASIIYHLKKSKLQGSYSLVRALRSKV